MVEEPGRLRADWGCSSAWRLISSFCLFRKERGESWPRSSFLGLGGSFGRRSLACHPATKLCPSSLQLQAVSRITSKGKFSSNEESGRSGPIRCHLVVGLLSGLLSPGAADKWRFP